jgi:tetratricopeptide (TPR) repeat protein
MALSATKRAGKDGDPGPAADVAPNAPSSAGSMLRRSSSRSFGPIRLDHRNLELGLRVAIVVVVVGSVLAVGAVHVEVLVPLAVIALLAAIAATRLRSETASLVWPAPAIVAVALSLFTLIQITPIPLTWLEAIAPANADVWGRALLPFNERPVSGSISLDPGASAVECLKWLVYGCVFAVASALAARRGATWGITVVFASAALTALATVGHDLVNATKVFGVYQPRHLFPSMRMGPLLNGNNLAGYLNLGALCGIGLIMTRRPLLPVWLVGVGVAAIVGVAVRSASRAGVAVLPIGVVALAILVRAARNRGGARSASRTPEWVLGAIIAGGTLFAVLGATPAVWSELFNKNLAKLDIVRWARPLVHDYAWLGVGRGAFESVFSAYRSDPGQHVIFTHIENFPAQWAAEWGLPVTVIALGALGWMFRPGKMGVLESAVFAGPWIGVAVLLAQNLLDLGLEIPGVSIAAAMTLGSIWGDPRRRRGRHTPSRIATALGLRSRVWLAAPCALGLAAIVLSVRSGAHDVGGDRAALRAAYERLEPSDRPGVLAFRGELRAAMLRHPADYYFPLLGASQAWRSRAESPIPWLQRSLERAPINGRAHLLLGEVLMSRGAKRQALFELRLAAEHDVATLARAAELAASWTSDFDELLLAVPVGVRGALMLDEMSRRLVLPEHAPVRERCEAEAIARDPAFLAPRMRQIEARLQALAATAGSAVASLCADRARCQREVEEHAQVISALLPESSSGAQRRARLLDTIGRSDEADRLLVAECVKPQDRGSCLELRADLAVRSSDVPRFEAALKEYLSDRCTSPATCAAAHAKVGAYRVQRGDLRAATVSFERAAREDPTEERWLQVADTAARAGMHGKAVEALEKVAQKRGGADSALQQRITAERAAAAGSMLR